METKMNSKTFSLILIRLFIERDRQSRQKEERENGEEMASFILRVPTANLRGFSVSAAASSSNGAVPGTGTGSTQKAGPMIVELPLDQIKRPLMRTRANDPNKVQELMQSIQQIGLQVPIDVLEVDGVYYGFSGCHRYEAHQRLGLPTIRCKVRRGTKETLRHHLR
ncbi:unnamed protein product [Linum tenue]|uniref:sulfiredoxin n=2 Tax=Linum tenue TaxID=586396 RepID=A0AAV0IWM8_9ROSI|nr:unnamed protein product [Linum tenue]